MKFHFGVFTNELNLALGHWIECNLSTWKDSCLTDMHIRSTLGSFGFYAWLDRKNEYYGVLGTTVLSSGTESAQFIDSIRSDIEAALVTMSPVNSPGSAQPGSLQSTGANTYPQYICL